MIDETDVRPIFYHRRGDQDHTCFVCKYYLDRECSVSDCVDCSEFGCCESCNYRYSCSCSGGSELDQHDVLIF